MPDMRERPWKRLRVVVEVTVPPTSRATEKDLIYAVEQGVGHTVALPRPIHKDAYTAVVRVKSFTKFLPAFLRKEKGLKTGRKKKGTEHDDFLNGL